MNLASKENQGVIMSFLRAILSLNIVSTATLAQRNHGNKSRNVESFQNQNSYPLTEIKAPKVLRTDYPSEIRIKTIDGERMTWVTVATKPNENLDRMVEIGDDYDLPINVVGMGDRRLLEWGVGFGLKMQLLKEFLVKLKKQEGNSAGGIIVIFSDAYDVLPLTGPKEILDSFLGYNTDILFSGEANCHPDNDRVGEYDRLEPSNIGLKFRYCNSGTFMGRLDPLLDKLTQNEFVIADDDQRYWTNLYMDDRKKAMSKKPMKYKPITVDAKAKVFGCLAFSLDDIEIDESVARYRNKLTNEYPAILHFNGVKGSFGEYDERWVNSKRNLKYRKKKF